MGSCKLCGRWAGMFKSVHSECQEKEDAEQAEQAAREVERHALVAKVSAQLNALTEMPHTEAAILSQIEAIGDPSREIIEAAFAEWVSALMEQLLARTVDQDEAERVLDFVVGHFALDPTALPDKLWGKFVRYCACGDMDRGKIPQRAKIAGSLPFNLEAGETVVWVFPGAEYLEDKVMRSASRGYAGVSVRVLPGVYAHTGQSAPMTTAEGFFPVDIGLLALSDRAVLFSGAHKALRIKYKDIVSFTRYDYGFAVCKGNATARNQAFEVQDDLASFPFILAEGLARLNMRGAH